MKSMNMATSSDESNQSNVEKSSENDFKTRNNIVQKKYTLSIDDERYNAVKSFRDDSDKSENTKDRSKDLIATNHKLTIHSPVLLKRQRQQSINKNTKPISKGSNDNNKNNKAHKNEISMKRGGIPRLRRNQVKNTNALKRNNNKEVFGNKIELRHTLGEQVGQVKQTQNHKTNVSPSAGRVNTQKKYASATQNFLTKIQQNQQHHHHLQQPQKVIKQVEENSYHDSQQQILEESYSIINDILKEYKANSINLDNNTDELRGTCTAAEAAAETEAALDSLRELKLVDLGLSQKLAEYHLGYPECKVGVGDTIFNDMKMDKLELSTLDDLAEARSNHIDDVKSSTSTLTFVQSPRLEKKDNDAKLNSCFVPAAEPEQNQSLQNQNKHQITNLNKKFTRNLRLSSVPENISTPKTPPVTPDTPNTYLDDDLESIFSFTTTASGRSNMSCEHPYVARNGTTFSGRKMKYVIHCSSYAGQVGNEYLTPTQRAQRQIRRLKELLCIARNDLERKDTEILNLTREVVELRLFKASLSSPDERSISSDAITVRELKTSQDVSPIIDMVDEVQKSSPRNIPQPGHHNELTFSSDMQSSYADSGHFEDMSVYSNPARCHSIQDAASGPDDICVFSSASHDKSIEEAATAEAKAEAAANYAQQRIELIKMYEQRIDDLIRSQDKSNSEIKRNHNDKVEALLLKLAECNTRYADLVPDYEHAKERIRELERQLEDLQRKLVEHEETQNKMYLHMYQQGQEAERVARADKALELARSAPNTVSITELLLQLQSTQDELENIRAAESKRKSDSNQALLTAKEAISLWVLGARKNIFRESFVLIAALFGMIGVSLVHFLRFARSHIIRIFQPEITNKKKEIL